MKILKKILKFLGILFLLIIPTLRVLINYEPSIWKYLYYILVTILIIIVFIKIFRTVKNKIINVSIFVVILFLVLNMVYYEQISIKLEPLIHIYNKYNIPYSKMDIVESKKSNNPIVGTFQPREAIIKVENIYINLHYGSIYSDEEQGWKDNYQYSKTISETINKYTNEFKYSIDYDSDIYYILLKKDEKYKMIDVIESFKKLEYSLDDFYYNITFVNDYRYEEIINNKRTAISSKNIGSVEYKNIDNYFDKKDFVSKKFLINLSESKKFDGFTFDYYCGDNEVYINGYYYVY